MNYIVVIIAIFFILTNIFLIILKARRGFIFDNCFLSSFDDNHLQIRLKVIQSYLDKGFYYTINKRK